jgi:hypothetical protein
VFPALAARVRRFAGALRACGQTTRLGDGDVALKTLADAHVLEAKTLGAVVRQQPLKAIQVGVQVQRLGAV